MRKTCIAKPVVQGDLTAVIVNLYHQIGAIRLQAQIGQGDTRTKAQDILVGAAIGGEGVITIVTVEEVAVSTAARGGHRQPEALTDRGSGQVGSGHAQTRIADIVIGRSTGESLRRCVESKLARQGVAVIQRGGVGQDIACLACRAC
jgi:hypothetical protein